LVDDTGMLIIMLFNLGLDLGLKFKKCKYCNHWFIVQHNRQVHCCKQHRIWYMNERKCKRRREERKHDPVVEFIDGHGKFVRMNARYLKRLGSMYTSEEQIDPNKNRIIDFAKERKYARNQVKALGLRWQSLMNTPY